MADAALAVLVADLFLAIQGLSGYAPPTVKPEVHRVSHATIEREICRGPCQIRAYYDPTRGVYIDETLDVQKEPSPARSCCMSWFTMCSRSAAAST
jgi:hypothetical protein